jgi:hypothetical protein
MKRNAKRNKRQKQQSHSLDAKYLDKKTLQERRANVEN